MGQQRVAQGAVAEGKGSLQELGGDEAVRGEDDVLGNGGEEGDVDEHVEDRDEDEREGSGALDDLDRLANLRPAGRTKPGSVPQLGSDSDRSLRLTKRRRCCCSR